MRYFCDLNRANGSERIASDRLRMSPGDWTYEDDFISHVQSEQLDARRRELSTASLIREVLPSYLPRACNVIRT